MSTRDQSGLFHTGTGWVPWDTCMDFRQSVVSYLRYHWALSCPVREGFLQHGAKHTLCMFWDVAWCYLGVFLFWPQGTNQHCIFVFRIWLFSLKTWHKWSNRDTLRLAENKDPRTNASIQTITNWWYRCIPSTSDCLSATCLRNGIKLFQQARLTMGPVLNQGNSQVSEVFSLHIKSESCVLSSCAGAVWPRGTMFLIQSLQRLERIYGFWQSVIFSQNVSEYREWRWIF